MPPDPTTQARADGFENVSVGLADQDRDWRRGYTIAPGVALQQAAIDALMFDPVAARIVESVPEHATRKWIELSGEGGPAGEDWAPAVMDALEDLDAQAKLTRLMALDRKDGGSVMLPGVDDGQALDQPLNRERIRSLKRLHVLERWTVNRGPLDTDPTSETFDQPEYYELLRAKAGAMTRVHPSRVIALDGIDVSEQQRLRNGGWGLSELDRTLPALREWNMAWEWVGAAMKHWTQTVVSIPGLMAMLSADKSKAILDRLAFMQRTRSVLNAVLLDAGGKDGDGAEKLEEIAVSFTGIAAVLDRAAERLSAATGIPITVLFGQSPGGLSTDDQSGTRNWHTAIAVKQRAKLRGPLNTLVELICLAQDGPTRGKVPERWQVTFVPLDEPSDEEISVRRNRDAQTDAIYLDKGVIDEREVRARLRSDPASPYQLESDEPPEPPEPDPMLVPPGSVPEPGEEMPPKPNGTQRPAPQQE